ncbi:glutathione transferase GstA [Rubrivivax gelatinosus]|uniref:Glutathione S-transferase n=1 Tax=Rubrivivax gelatinosus TaxID=28068 RepID=A0A4R2LT17_RUBGE|nr:glutathione transferase GstA [Rubrivivax gelatinosus]MBK1690276.1 glutathione transferase GstA [Rubrivivax gelatinosus]TCO97181.1 glutathione S-transferase [Rubrivivax gelatinosus]
MKLYYSPGACSLSPHIVLLESGLAFQAVMASTKTHRLADGTDYYTINPKGYVPLLELDSGERLSEGPAIVQWIADQVPEKKLAPPAGTMARYRLVEWLNFISTELHKGFSPLFTPGMPEEAKALFRSKLGDRFAHVDAALAEPPYLLGEDFSVADAYLFVVSSWAKHVGVDLSRFAHLARFLERVGARPAVQQAMRAEGLIRGG